MSRQFLFGRGTTSGTTSLRTSMISGEAVASAKTVWTTMPLDGTLRQLRIKGNISPGSGTEITWEIYVNDVASGLSVTLVDLENSGFDVTNVATFSAGDTVEFRITSTSTGNMTFLFYMVCTSRIADYSLLAATTANPFTITADAVEYLAPCGFQASPTSTLAQTEIIIPTSGVLRNPHFQLKTAPGSSFRRTFSVFKNGVAVMLTSIVGSATSNSAVTSESVAKNDLITFEMKNGSVSPASSNGTMSCVFESDTPDTFIMPSFPTNTLPSSAGFKHAALYNRTQSWASFATALFRDIRGGLICTDMSASILTDPGGSASRRFVIRNGFSNTGLDLTISAGSTTGSVSATVDVAELDQLAIRQIPASSPAVSYATVSVAAKMQPIVDDMIFRVGL